MSLCLAGLPLNNLFAADGKHGLVEAGTKYYDGQVDEAIKLLKPIADAAVAAAPSPNGKAALEYLLDACVGSYDFACLNEYGPKYSRFVNAMTDVPDQMKLPFGLQPSYYSAAAVWLSGNQSWMEAWLKDWPETEPAVPWVPRDYIRRQLMRANLYLYLGKTDAARLCVDRALASLASIDNAGSLLEVSGWLFEAINDLLALGDTERAIGLSLVNLKVGQRIFPLNSLEYFRLLRTAASTYEAAGLVPQARDAIERSLTVLSHLHVNRNLQTFYAADAATFAALICIVSNDFACARRHLDEHPMRSSLEDIRKRGVLQSLPEVSFLAARALVSTGLRETLDPKDVLLLSRPIEIRAQLPQDLIDLATMYEGMGHAIALLQSEPDRSAAEFRALAPELIRLESKITDSVGFLPRRGLIDQLLLAVTTNAFREVPLDPQSGDALVKLLDIAARNSQSYSSEALGLIATAQTDEVRTDIKDLLRLRSRRDSSERIDVARVLASKPAAGPQGEVLNPTVDFKRRNIYTDYGNLIRQLSAHLRSDQPNLAAADAPPSLEKIQGSLRKDEVILGAPILAGLMGHICISKEQIWFSTTNVDGPGIQRDIRILEAALSSQNAPSIELDRQYPVSPARRLYDALILPVQSCLKKDASIMWVGSGVGNVSLAALLTRGTSEELVREPLSMWPWLLQEHAVAQIATVSTLVALRRETGASVPINKPQFLGVGDPSFNGSAAAPENAGSYAIRGAAGASGLTSLPPLPETRSEINGIAALFNGRQTQLLGDSATESEFRRLPLERYTYIEFATHGLVREDISGLTEAALALTPGDIADSFDDGLLTASEIADLPIKASFVALSACNTALLDYTKFASEVTGLSEAFAIAGVPATLATLWPVNSDASRQIAQDTFRSLISDKVAPSVALAAAQRRYLANATETPQQHPRFWAPFVVYGDGFAPSERRTLTESSQIGNVRLLTESGGEVSSITDGGSGNWLIRATGDVRVANRHASMTVKLRADLSEEWRKEDPLIANSGVALRLDGGSLLGGYTGGGATPTVAKLVYMDDVGNVKQQWELPRGDLDTFPMTASRIGPRSALIAVLEHDSKADPKLPWPSDRLVIAELRVGRPMRVRTEFETITQFGPSYVGMEAIGSDILVIVTRPTGNGLPKSHVDDFHQLTSCGLEGHTSLTMLKGPALSKVWEKSLPDIEVAASSVANDGSVQLTGSVRLGCGEGTRIGLWKVNRAGELINLFTDSNPRDSKAHGLIRRPDGSMLLLGITSRTTDVDSLAERDPQRFINKGAANTVTFSTRRVDDAVIITLDSAFKKVSRETLRSGADIWARGAISVGSNLWLYGALGNQAAIVQVVH